MSVGRRLIPIAAVVAALGASAGGAAFAAETGTGGSAASSDKTGGPVVAKCIAPGELGRKAEADFAAVAKQLGVSVDQLRNAMVSTKQWFGTSGVTPTPQAFAEHVASLLGKSAADVTKAFENGGVVFKAHGAMKVGPGGLAGKIGQVLVQSGGALGRVPAGKLGAMVEKCGVASHRAPDLAKAAKELGVSTDQLQNALVSTKQWLGSSGVTPTPDGFIQHLASVLGVSPDRVKQALGDAGFMIVRAGANPAAK